MKTFFRTEIPLWGVIIGLVLIGLGMLAIFAYLGPAPRLYSVSLPPEKLSFGELQYGEEPRLSDPDIFEKVKADFVAQGISFIEADLSTMKLSVYQSGATTLVVPILTKGREGSWWETPAGIYKVETKEKSHFSSFGHVYQPWSMAFQGNFFIHGWPYYEGGNPVSSQYSGGCIRLSDENAKAVYDLAETGMPVLVFEHDFGSDAFTYAKRRTGITAENYLAADLGNNFVFLEQASISPLPISAFGQFLLSLVSAEYINMEKSIFLDNDSLATTSGRLRSGEEVTPFDLLHLMLLESSWEPFPIFADILGEKRLLGLMNGKARAVGMSKTRADAFDAAAFDLSGETTAQDLFHLAKYLSNNRNFILEMSAEKLSNKSYGETRLKGLKNENLFAADSRFLGGKAVLGDTDNVEGVAAEEGDLFGVFKISVRGEERRIFIFLKHSTDIVGDIERAIQYIRESYE